MQPNWLAIEKLPQPDRQILAGHIRRAAINDQHGAFILDAPVYLRPSQQWDRDQWHAFWTAAGAPAATAAALSEGTAPAKQVSKHATCGITESIRSVLRTGVAMHTGGLRASLPHLSTRQIESALHRMAATGQITRRNPQCGWKYCGE